MEKETLKVEQEGWCGPAALAYMAREFGIPANKYRLARLMETTKEDGTSIKNMEMGARTLGLRAFTLTYTTINELKRLKTLGYGVIVDWMDGDDCVNDGHYSVFKEANDSRVILYDPNTDEYRTMTRRTFEAKWFDYEDINLYNKVERWVLAVKK
jgi:ABC-type bacteriocin/lantibiotic exporter with double-glycine peptidase domain